MNKSYLAVAFLASLAVTLTSARADVLYSLHFEDDAGKKTLTNAGTVKSQADEIPGYDASIEFTRKTHSGSGFALHIPMDASGTSGPAISLPDSEKRLSLENANDEITIAMWIRWSGKNKVDNNDFQMLVSKMSDSQDDGWAFGVTQTGALRFLIGGQGSRFSKDQIPTDQWTHIAMVFRPRSGLHLFINGKESALDQDLGVSTVKPNKQPVLIGSALGKYLPCNATIDDLTVYDEIIAGDDIELLMSPQPAATTKESPKKQ